MTFAGAINMQLDYNTLNKGDGTMYSLFEELAKRQQKPEGIIEICLDCGLSDDTILEKLQQN